MLKHSFTIALRELRHGYRGFWVFFSCLSLGVAAITAVTTLSTSMLNGIERDGRIILGGDLAIGQQFQDLSDEQVQQLSEAAESVTKYVELRTLMRTQNLENSILVSLKAVDDFYPLYGRFEIFDDVALFDALAVSDGIPGALVDESVVESGKASLGTLISIGKSQYQVRGIISNEPDRIGSSGSFAFWPRVLIHRSTLEDTGLVDFGSRSYYEYRLRLPDGDALNELRTQIEEQHPRFYVRDFHNASPDLTEIVQRLGILLSLAGLTTLLIGGIGASNAVRAYMNTRLPTIAILKCVGAPTRFVMRVYLIQIALLAAIGVGMGVVFGVGISILSAASLEAFLSVPISITFTPQIAALVITYGLLTAFLFSLWPLACSLETRPAALFRNVVTRESQSASWIYIAISIAIALLLAAIVTISAHEREFAVWFVLGITGAWIVFRVISASLIKMSQKIHRLRSPAARLAIANLHRPGASTSDIVLAVGLGLSVLVATAMVSSNLDRQMTALIPEKAPSFFFVGIQSAQLEEFKRLVLNANSVQDLDVLPYIPGQITKIKGMDPRAALVDEGSEWIIDDDGERTFSYTAKARDDGSLVSGEWWSEDYDGPPLLSIHIDVAQGFGLEIGDTITMNILGREITGAVHNVRDLSWRSMRLNFAIMLSPEPLRSIPHSSVGTVRVVDESELELQETIASTFPNVTVIRIKDALNRVNELMLRGRDAARGVSGLTIVAGILVLAGIVISENRRRAYESVLLKTIGASRRYILTAFSLEYLIQGGVAALAAIILGAVTSWAVVHSLMGWEWYFVFSSAAYTVVLGLMISCIMGMMGIWQALKHRPLEYLRNE